MPFTDVAPPTIKKPGTGISLSLRKTARAGVTARLTFTEQKQRDLFGDAIHGRAAHIQVGRGVDEGRLRLVFTEDGEFTFSSGVQGSASIVMAAWDLLPKDKRPAEACTVHSRPSNYEVILTLPKFCRPSGLGGKLEQEHGLKPTKSRG